MPIYKAEKYLDKCVTSILQQTFRDFELLLIDDGSPDCCVRMCDEYALRDSRVKVFHKPNGGVSSARQLGTEKAQGEYIIHADPDDWVEKDMLEELYSAAQANDYDVVFCDFWTDTEKGSFYTSQKTDKLDNFSLITELLGHSIHGSCCNKLVKKSCFRNVCFPENLNYCEDLYVNLHILNNGAKVGYLNKAFYHYNYFSSDESLTRTKMRSLLAKTNDFTDRVKKFISPEIHQRAYSLHYAMTAMLVFSSKEFSTCELRNLIKLWEKETDFRKEMSLKWRVIFFLSAEMYLYRPILLCKSLLQTIKNKIK